MNFWAISNYFRGWNRDAIYRQSYLMANGFLVYQNILSNALDMHLVRDENVHCMWSCIVI